MKYLLIIFVSVSCFASKWYSETDLTAFINNTHDGVVVYKTNKRCKLKEKQKCYDITGKNIRYYRLKQVSIDDQTKMFLEDPVLKAAYKAEVALAAAKALSNQEAQKLAKALVKESKGKVEKLSKKKLDALLEKILILLDK